MRLCVFSDVHGNLPALEAVLAEIEGLKPDLVVNLGDCASGPLWPAETVRLLRTGDILHVRGNHDRALGAPAPEALGVSDSFAWRSLDADARRWLHDLPPALLRDGLHCFHASPDSDETYLMEEVRDARLVFADAVTVSSRLGMPRGRLLCCGHSHLPRLLALADGALMVNPGSVGCPAYDDRSEPPHVSESGAPHARFALVTMAGTIAVEHRAVPYDWERAARMALANGRPDWAHALRTGTVRLQNA